MSLKGFAGASWMKQFSSANEKLYLHTLWFNVLLGFASGERV